ncbi:MAG TPA: ParA family protein [Blastocatellia bacterium]
MTPTTTSPSPIVIAVANQKGGVGKTTITRELSACCALRGHQVLAIDCDPQANLTASWLDSGQYQLTLANVMLEPDGREGGKKLKPAPLEQTIMLSPVTGLDIVPADIRVARVEMAPDYATHRLRSQIRSHGGAYDFIFLDCPPQLGKLLTSALYAADYVLIPCSADAMGLQGLADLVYTIDQIRQNVNQDLKILGAVMNLYKPQRNLSAESRAAVEAAMDLVQYVFDTNIHDYSKIAEAPSQKLPLALYAASHRATDQFNSLTEEFLDRLKAKRRKLKAIK